MSERTELQHFPIIPKNESPCVWMEAGVVSYKICDREFDCENCPLDIGLRGDSHKIANWYKTNFLKKVLGRNKSQSKVLSAACKRLIKFKIDERRYVSSEHCWILIRKKNLVRIGIDDVVATALGSIDDISLPKENSKIKRGTSCSQIIQFEHIFSIVSPVSGIVTTVNRDLEHFPNKLIFDPLQTGWLMEIKTDNLDADLQYCRTGDTLLSWYLKEIKWLESNFSKGYSNKGSMLGATLADGGELSRNLRNFLPSDQYRRLIISFLGTPDSASSK